MRINDPNESASPKTRADSDSILTLILGTAEDSRPSVKLRYLGPDDSYRLFVFCKTSGARPCFSAFSTRSSSPERVLVLVCSSRDFFPEEPSHPHHDHYEHDSIHH